MIPRHNAAPRAKLPAYARPLADLRHQGQRPAGETVIVRLDSWPPKWHFGADLADVDGRALSVCCPQVTVSEDADPSALDFSFARDLDAIVPHWRSKSPPSRLRALLRRVLQADPRRLIVLDMERSGRAWFIKSVDRGVEVQL
ncbi:hypothetical protein CGK74_16855 [Thauera propionica]|uniref:Uncharacterized protein n=1 Tax=Thauera propionica TaxID=2019431 RepID=A0A235EUD7_9RHOO|nr:hypothetical protein [Thauera propionica]OYD52640.1 hypothetical protein CGK74_16855 [Thauera propionica]